MHRLLALLTLALPAVATAAPSAINIDAALAHDRELLASHAMALCACKDMACGEPHADAYLRWELDQSLMSGRRGYEDYLAAVAKDSAIASWRQELEDCNALLHIKPTARVCKARMASAARAFAREAPRAYEPYRRLDFRQTVEPTNREPPQAVAAVRIHPGRSWGFRAVVGPHSIVRDFGIAIDQVGDQWGKLPLGMGVMAARKHGPIVTVIAIESERWGDFEPEDHPLAKLFLAKLMAAGDKCMQPRR